MVRQAYRFGSDQRFAENNLQMVQVFRAFNVSVNVCIQINNERYLSVFNSSAPTRRESYIFLDHA